MVRLVALLEPAQDRDRVRHRGLADEDRLETALERGVLLDVLAVLVERRRADGAQLAAREHRLQQVRRVDGALRRARADDRVQLVDEEDDLAGGVLDLPEDRLEPLLELAAVLRAREQRTDVERPDTLALEPLGDVARDDPLREALDDRGLADSGLADQDRVVLRTAREDLDHAPDLLVAADDRVELAGLRERGEVAPVLLERLVGALGVLRGDLLASADLLQRAEQCIARDHVERQQEMLDGGELVAELAHLLERAVEHAPERGGRLGLHVAAGDARLVAETRLRLGAQLAGAVAGAVDERARQLLVEQREREVVGRELGVAHPAREVLRGRDGLLGLERELLEIHPLPPPHGVLRRGVDDQLTLVRAVDGGDLRAKLALEALHPRIRPAQLVLQPEHLLDACEVEPELGRQPLDEPEPLDVPVGVEPGPAGRPRRLHEPLRLVQAERLRVHADELGRDGDHVPGTLGHQPRSAFHPRSRATAAATMTHPSAAPTRSRVASPSTNASSTRLMSTKTTPRARPVIHQIVREVTS